jgi:hypoxanthine phosphoribosyltransferase
MEIIINREQITQRVKDLAIQISQDHIDSGNAMPPVMICILNGSIHFFSDLTRAMTVDCELDFLRLKSYEGQDNSGGIKCLKELELELKGKRDYIV